MRMDQLVMACESLAQAEVFCLKHLGCRPVPGGKHPLMGTENSLVRLGPRTYLEFIAVDPTARPPMRPRWLQMDDPRVQGAIQHRGPQLLTYMVAVDDGAVLDSISRQLRPLVGEPFKGSRVTPTKQVLEWTTLVRPDGLLPFDGRFPTFINWSSRSKHPCDLLPPGRSNSGDSKTKSKVIAQQDSPILERLVVKDSQVLRTLRETLPFVQEWSGIEGGLSIVDHVFTSDFSAALSSSKPGTGISAVISLPQGGSVTLEGMDL